jgi:hypothetical protein
MALPKAEQALPEVADCNLDPDRCRRRPRLHDACPDRYAAGDALGTAEAEAGRMIRICKAGTTRLVLVAGPWAFKLARGERGRRCSKYEAELFKNVDDRRREMLCRVRWCSNAGRVLIMDAAQPLTESDHANLLDRDEFPDWDYMPEEDEDGEPFEYKASDWGRLKDGSLVALDYSTPAHLTKDELDELIRKATWPD